MFCSNDGNLLLDIGLFFAVSAIDFCLLSSKNSLKIGHHMQGQNRIFSIMNKYLLFSARFYVSKTQRSNFLKELSFAIEHFDFLI